MKFNVIVEEDSVTPYLNDIENRLNASREEIIREIGEKFAEEGASRAPVWAGNLSQSVLSESQWHLFASDEFFKLDIVFSGVVDDVDQWWWEFEDPSLPEGGRDYAYFQETGIDKKAVPEKARDQGYVRRSTKPTQKFADEYLVKEIKRVMKG